MTFVAALGSLPARVKLIAGLAVAVAALLVAGVPISSLVPFAGVAGCLGMHLFMGHGDHHSARVAHSPETDRGAVPVELAALDR
jgi:hypothetical protein